MMVKEFSCDTVTMTFWRSGTVRSYLELCACVCVCEEVRRYMYMYRYMYRYMYTVSLSCG